MAMTIRKIKAKDLRIPTEYQREINPRHCLRLQANWKDSTVGILTGSLRDDGYVYLVDGQQRHYTKLMLMQEPNYVFTVEVHDDLTIPGEAAMFDDINGLRQPVPMYDKWRAGVVAGNLGDVAIRDVVDALGLKVGRTSSANVVGCVGTLRRVVNRGAGFSVGPVKKQKAVAANKVVLSDTLRIMNNVYAGAEEPWSSYIVEGMFAFLTEWGAHPKFSEPSLVQVLSKWLKPPAIVLAARARAATNNRPSGEVAAMILEQYNRGKKVNALS